MLGNPFWSLTLYLTNNTVYLSILNINNDYLYKGKYGKKMLNALNRNPLMSDICFYQ